MQSTTHFLILNIYHLNCYFFSTDKLTSHKFCDYRLSYHITQNFHHGLIVLHTFDKEYNLVKYSNCRGSLGDQKLT